MPGLNWSISQSSILDGCEAVRLRAVGSQPKMASHLFGLTQDIVVVAKWQKCALKYEIFSQPEKREKLFAPPVAACGYAT